MPHSVQVAFFIDPTAEAPEGVLSDKGVPAVRIHGYPAYLTIQVDLDLRPDEQYAAYRALAAACEELAEAILQRSMAGAHAESEPA